MNKFRLLRLLSLCAVLAACGILPQQAKCDDSTADRIVGKWVPASGKEKDTFVEFTKDGELTYAFGTADERIYKGKYKVIDDKTVEVEWTEETLKKNNFLSKKPKKVKMSLTKDAMTCDPLGTIAKKNWVRSK